MKNRDFQQELEYFKLVSCFITKQLQTLEGKRNVLRDEVSVERLHMWEDGRHIIRDFDDVAQLSMLDSEIRRVENNYLSNSTEIHKLFKIKKTPYFGRIDFVENDSDEQKVIYIGTYSLINHEKFRFYVYDWRTPICSLFYEYDIGNACYEAPSMKIEGKVVLKRQFKITDEELINIYDTNSPIHDDILSEILSNNTNNKLKVIVSSIQKEQNIAIRSFRKRAALIYGPAGSGKTSVGLHRLAYLLYHQRKTINSSDIVILSNNNIYSSYISNILPELDENEIPCMLFYDLITTLLPKNTHIEDYYSQFWEIERAPLSDRVKCIKIKNSYDMLCFCIKYFEDYSFKIPDIMYKNQIIVSQDYFEKKLDGRKYSTYKSKLGSLLEMIKNGIEDYFLINKSSIIENISNSSDEFLMKDELELIFKKVIKKCLSDTIDQVRNINQIDAVEQLKNIVNLYSKKSDLNNEMVVEIEKSLQKRHILYEDALLYLLIRLLMGEISTFDNVKHVLIDESQDYSLLQLYVIKILYPKSSFTLLADVWQAIHPTTGIKAYDEYEWIFGNDLDKITLFQSYRSSGPINALAFELITKFGGQITKEYSYYMRDGKAPQYIITENYNEKIVQIINNSQHYNTIGILTDCDEDAKNLFKTLKESIDLQLIDNPSDEIKDKILIMPIILAKGLEFDTVILYHCMKNIEKDGQHLRMVYVACTRALHELYIIENTQVSNMLTECISFLDIKDEQTQK